MDKLRCIGDRVMGTLMSVCRELLVISVIVWAGFHYGDKSELGVVDSIMNQPVHVRQQSLFLWLRATFKNNICIHTKIVIQLEEV